MEFHENNIEWLSGEELVTMTFTQRKFINKIEKYAELYPNDVLIVVRNKDGSIVAKMPLSYLRITKPREYTEEERQLAAERFKQNISKNMN